MTLPVPAGPRSEALIAALRGPVGSPVTLPDLPGPVMDDVDAQLALYVAGELHYGGWDDVDPAWEWDPALRAAVAPLEARLEAELRALPGEDDGTPMGAQLFALAAADDAPSLSGYVQREATREQALEYLIGRSSVQLKEADAQAWLIPRLRGAAKAPFIEVQDDEYGGGVPGRLHSQLWAQALRAAGLRDGEHDHVDRWPASALATINTQTLFGLHARLLGAGLGFFAIVEMTSSVPMRRYQRGLDRLGFGDAVTEYFDEHVVADAAHEQLMALAVLEPWCDAPEAPEAKAARRADVLLGARACLALDGAFARHCLDAWAAGQSALR